MNFFLRRERRQPRENKKKKKEEGGKKDIKTTPVFDEYIYRSHYIVRRFPWHVTCQQYLSLAFQTLVWKSNYSLLLLNMSYIGNEYWESNQNGILNINLSVINMQLADIVITGAPWVRIGLCFQLFIIFPPYIFSPSFLIGFIGVWFINTGFQERLEGDTG